MTAKQEHRADVIRRLRNPRCGLRHRGGCSGRLQADHVIEVAWLEDWRAQARLAGGRLLCLACGGAGVELRSTFRVVPVCCGKTRPDGDCCGVPVPESVEEVDTNPCATCGGAGEASLDAMAADGRNGWMLCEGHHTLKTRCLLRPPITRRELAPTVEAFCDDYRCEHLLERVLR